MNDARASLGKILQNAHAGEIAAAFAYRGHWKSVSDARERERIRQIEDEEWDHRSRVRFWMEELHIRPRRTRELVFRIIGRGLGVLCFVSGRFLPMYFAGRLESRNTAEYLEAAKFASILGMEDCVSDLIHMSDKEREHEEYFREVVKGHWLLPTARLIFRWS
ncbi:MAG: demethoxyubiquinone hydroxylase family protein [Aridibacter famidurans]|nr:demethoxyubiquinone hydroxylase family protein [Aridibacter famidurans]